MAPSIAPIRVSTHSAKRWRKVESLAFAASSAVIAVTPGELGSAALNFPLAFIRNDGTPLVAIQGLSDRNLFVGADGRWLGQYLPALYQVHPFKLMQTSGEEFALGFDDASGLLSDDPDALPFFDAEGKPTPEVQSVLNSLIRIRAGLRQMAKVSELLNKHDLLEEWPLKIAAADGEKQVAGLLRVSEERLSKLSGEALAELRDAGALSVAYAQLLSMGNINLLGRLAHAHARHAEQLARQSQDVSSMFAPTVEEEELDWNAILKDD